MISKTIQLLILTLVFDHLNARNFHFDTNWDDLDINENFNSFPANDNWETSNSVAQSNFLDYDKKQFGAKAQKANWIRGAVQVVRTVFTEEAIRGFMASLPRPIIAPASEFTTESDIPRSHVVVNRTTKAPKRRKYKTLVIGK